MFGSQLSLGPTLTSADDYWKNHSFDYWTSVGKVMSLVYNKLSRFVITFLSSFNFIAAVTICSDFGPQENKVCHYFHCFPICLEVMELDVTILIFFNIEI